MSQPNPKINPYSQLRSNDYAAFVELVNNQSDDELAQGDADPKHYIGAGGCFALTIALVTVVFALAFIFS
jgi:hypothetical protein